MLLYNVIFLPVILFIGFVTSYDDFRESRIKNKWIVAALAYVFLIYLAAWILLTSRVTNAYLLLINFDKWCVNLGVSILVAYLLWHFKMWGAGDAKLFICYSSLIPMGQYSRVYFNYYFASFLLLLAIFIPATIYLFLKSGIFFIKKLNFNEIKEKIPKLVKERLTKIDRIELGKVLLGLFVFFLFFRILSREFGNFISGFLPDKNILMLASLLVFKPLSRISKKNIRFIIITFIILIVYVVFKLTYFWQQLIFEIGSIFTRSILIMILFPVFKKIIDIYEERTVHKTTPFAIWMFLGVLITWFLR